MEKRIEELRALDARVAELLDYKIKGDTVAYNRVGELVGIPNFSNPFTMLQLDAEMQRRGWCRVTMRVGDNFQTAYYRPNEYGIGIYDLLEALGERGNTEPESVARAAEAALQAEKGAGE